MDHQSAMRLLAAPPKSARPKTRWWWYGCKVREEDIVYQIEEMQKAGIGGVELQITYPLQAGDDNYAYFSPDYFRILSFTSKELHRRDMTLDITLGSSWPFGGPFVPFAKSAVHVIPLELTVEGPASFSYDFTNRVAGEIVGCVMGRMEGCEMLPESIVDLQGYLADRLLYNWPWGTKLDQVPVPEGVWKIVVFAASQFREHVLMPTRGAEGYVIDHNNREAMRFFLEHAGTPIVKRLGAGAVDNFFCDSLEVFGHNWSIDLYDAFEKRRGYSLRPYIYALWGQIKGLTDKIRYDFHKTLSELTVAGFFEEMTAWCHEMGSKSRIQAHGTWGDVLLAYAAADIPEGETFSAWDKFSVNTVHRRLASSAGHLYGRPVISNESFTWLRFPRFCETPEQIKIAADSIFMDGINQIVNHGYSYSPREGAGEETLYFYASSNISHTNTWWEYYPHVASYIARVSAFLQMGKPVAGICIYLPQADVWAENPLSDLHMCMKLEEKLETAAVDGIARAGYWFDYINDDAIEAGWLSRYEALLIFETERIPAAAARRIDQYARSGGKVICAGQLPSKDCGLAGDADVAGIFARLRREGALSFAADKWDALIDCLAGLVEPDLQVSEGRENIGYVHRSLEDGQELYFVANMSPKDYHTRLRFRDSYLSVKAYDPLTAEAVPVALEAVPEKDAGERDESVVLPLYFPAGQSYLLVLSRRAEDPGEPDRPAGEAMPGDAPKAAAPGDVRVPAPLQRRVVMPGRDRVLERTDLSGNWLLTVPALGFTADLAKLEGFEKIPALRYFSGEAVYERSFTVGEEALGSGRLVLCCEALGCCGRVFVNGRPVTDWIMRPYEADLTPFVHAGENTLRISVSNLLINRFIDPERKIYAYPDEIMDAWPYFPQQLIKERGKRLDNWRELAMVKEPLPAGLMGSVTLLRIL